MEASVRSGSAAPGRSRAPPSRRAHPAAGLRAWDFNRSNGLSTLDTEIHCGENFCHFRIPISIDIEALLPKGVKKSRRSTFERRRKECRDPTQPSLLEVVNKEE